MTPRRRRALAAGFSLAILLGIDIYFRLWVIDSRDRDSFSDDDLEALRREFERANMDAMDESAAWRMRFDEEVEKAKRIQDELLKVKASLAAATRSFDTLQKEKVNLQKQLQSMRQQSETKQQQCNALNYLLQRDHKHSLFAQGNSFSEDMIKGSFQQLFKSSLFSFFRSCC